MNNILSYILHHIASFLDFDSLYSFAVTHRDNYIILNSMIRNIRDDIVKQSVDIYRYNICEDQSTHLCRYMRNIDQRCYNIISENMLCNIHDRPFMTFYHLVYYSYRSRILDICYNRFNLHSNILLELTKKIWQDKYGNDRVIVLKNKNEFKLQWYNQYLIDENKTVIRKLFV